MYLRYMYIQFILHVVPTSDMYVNILRVYRVKIRVLREGTSDARRSNSYSYSAAKMTNEILVPASGTDAEAAADDDHNDDDGALPHDEEASYCSTTSAESLASENEHHDADAEGEAGDTIASPHPTNRPHPLLLVRRSGPPAAVQSADTNAVKESKPAAGGVEGAARDVAFNRECDTYQRGTSCAGPGRSGISSGPGGSTRRWKCSK